MTKKITVVISFDGTGNNKSSGALTGNESNVARLHNQLETDFSFDFSQNTKSGTTILEKVSKGVEGTQETFTKLLKSENPDIESKVEAADSYKIYLDGVGSQENSESFTAKTEAGMGFGVIPRVKEAVDVIDALKSRFPDAKIEIFDIGGSRGATTARAFANDLMEKYPEGSGVHLKTSAYLDTVASMGLASDENHWGVNLGSPANTDSNYSPFEATAANEYRDDTFSNVPYQNENGENQRFPGAHAQIVGGYANDILSTGSYTAALVHLEQSGLTFKPMEVDDIVNLRLYNAAVQNPYLLRTLITDSRIMSTDLKHPGVIQNPDDLNGSPLLNRPFPFEDFENYEFDTNVNQRHVTGETDLFSNNPFTNLIDDGLEGVTQVFDSDSFYAAEQEQNDLQAKYGSSGISITDISLENYQPNEIPLSSRPLPPELEEIVAAFESRIEEIGANSEDLDALENISEAIDDLQEATKEFTESLQELAQTEFSAEDANGQKALYSLIDKGETITTRLDYLETSQEAEARELDLQENEESNKAQSDAFIAELNSFDSLSEAVDTGDDFEIAGSVTDYILSVENLFDKHDTDNFTNISTNKGDAEDAGFLSEQSEAMLGAVSSGFSLADSIEQDDTFQTVGSSIDLLSNIDNYLDARAKYDNGNSTTSDNSGLSTLQRSNVDLAGAAANLAIAIDSGDDLDRTSAGVNLAVELTDSDALGKIGSIIGLAQSIAYYDDALESGDATSIGIATATVANDAVNSYNTLATFSNNMEVIPFDGGSYLGAIAAGAQLAEGDTKGALHHQVCRVSNNV